MKVSDLNSYRFLMMGRYARYRDMRRSYLKTKVKNILNAIGWILLIILMASGLLWMFGSLIFLEIIRSYR